MRYHCVGSKMVVMLMNGKKVYSGKYVESMLFFGVLEILLFLEILLVLILLMMKIKVFVVYFVVAADLCLGVGIGKKN